MKLFWLILTVTCLLWYSVVTIYVAIKGFGDIRHMLDSLTNRAINDDSIEENE
ncbi:MAG: hypothetical protein ACK5NT_01815 [Pyrinomonadaceae bacterium]